MLLLFAPLMSFGSEEVLLNTGRICVRPSVHLSIPALPSSGLRPANGWLRQGLSSAERTNRWMDRADARSYRFPLYSTGFFFLQRLLQTNRSADQGYRRPSLALGRLVPFLVPLAFVSLLVFLSYVCMLGCSKHYEGKKRDSFRQIVL